MPLAAPPRSRAPTPRSLSAAPNPSAPTWSTWPNAVAVLPGRLGLAPRPGLAQPRDPCPRIGCPVLSTELILVGACGTRPAAGLPGRAPSTAPDGHGRVSHGVSTRLLTGHPAHLQRARSRRDRRRTIDDDHPYSPTLYAHHPDPTPQDRKS